MKAIALLATLALAAGCTTNGAVATAGSGVEYRVVTQSGYATTERADAVIAADETTFRNTWAQSLGNEAPPAINFATETAVFLFGGTRPTGGYAVEVRGVTLENGTLIIDGGVTEPPPGSGTTQAITYPTAVLAVKSRDIRSVRWNPSGGR